MILGTGTTAQALRANIGEVPFVWVAYDNDGNQTEHFLQLARPHLRALEFEQVVAVSTQFPVGTCARLEYEYPGLWFAVVPENLRAASATEDWKAQDRIVIGARRFSVLEPLIDTLEPFTDQLLFMSPESAEMVKHATNGFLALSVCYANEIARLCADHGADPDDVARALMADGRIGERAYLKPGPGLSAHLERELDNLLALGAGPLIGACR